MDKKRCRWCNTKNPLYTEYHDTEWCVPNFSQKYLYEMLMLESFQAGLSWECILNKRGSFRKAYDDFDIEKIINYGEEKTEELLGNKDIIRNKLKIRASINNSRLFKIISEEYGSFYNYLLTFYDGKTIYETNKTTNELSDRISRDLKKRGMKFVGSTIIYSYLQAVGIIHSHEEQCYLHKGS
ncbi:MAG: DNA-3-methyladenine glycosylase I [Clostridia bacterium]|nr:DNA-3-methyladenine glycosylase I [Clostridia bacterium]